MAPAVVQIFKRRFGHAPPWAVRVPAPLTLLGASAEWGQGLSLTIALNRFLHLALTPRTDGRIDWIGDEDSTAVEVSVSQLQALPQEHWARPAVAVLEELQRHGVPLRGFNAAVQSDIPPAAGLHRSTALQVATALALRLLHPYRLTPTGCSTPPTRDAQGQLPPPTKGERIEIARLCAQALQRATGEGPSLEAPLSCLFAKAFHAAEIDFQSLAIEWAPLLGELALILGVPAGHWSPCLPAAEPTLTPEALQRALGIRSLRGLDPRDLETARARLNDSQYQAVRRLTDENRRVIHGARALQAGDLEQFGQYLNQSHDDRLQRFLPPDSGAGAAGVLGAARRHPGCLGAIATTPLQHPAVLLFVRRDASELLLKSLSAITPAPQAPALHFSLCQTADAATALDLRPGATMENPQG